MAVAQGYGKTVTSGSVFAYDVADTRNSYIGEPTTNLALFSVISGITFNADYAALTSQAADYNVTYRGRPSLRCTSTGQWNIYKYPRPGNYTATSSTVFTFSWKMKWSDGRVPAFSNGYIYTDAQYFYPAVTVTPIEDGWYLCQTISSGTSSPVYLTGFTTTQYGACYIADWQVEAKSHATSFTPAGTTRSATQGLLPLVGNSTLDLSNVSFDSNAQMVFDGTDDYLDFTSPNLSGTATIEMLCKIGSGYSDKMFFGWLAYDVWCGSGHLGYNTGNGDVYGISSSTVSSLGLVNNWKHYIFEMRSDVSYTNNKIYINGTSQTLSQQLSGEAPGNRNFNSGNGRIADWRITGYYMPMDCAIFKVYNRALLAAEVRQNYLHYKTRFNLS